MDIDISSLPADCAVAFTHLTERINALEHVVERQTRQQQSTNNDVLSRLREIGRQRITMDECKQILEAQSDVIRTLRSRLSDMLEEGVVYVSDEKAAETIQHLEDKLEKAHHHIATLEEEVRALRHGLVPDYQITFTPEG